MLDRKGADGDGMLWPRDVFFFWCLSLLPNHVSSFHPEPARSLPIQPEDASLAPPSGKTEVSMGVASEPLFVKKKKRIYF